MNYSLNDVCNHFNMDAVIDPYGNGHINDTYLCDNAPRYILQRINHNVFASPENLMENIANVTKFLKKKIKEAGGNPERETLTVIPTIDGKNYYKDENGNYFRMYIYIEDSVSYDTVEDPIQLYYAGKSFGRFQNMLNDYPADTLYETIVDFHNTPVRVKQLEEAIKNNKAGRLDSVKAEVDFALEYSKYASTIVDAMKEGTVPLRVTHNDTKLNNILFDKTTGEGACVIDLDTVMPGSMLYDFGDAMRFGAASGAEDEVDLSKIWFDVEKFEQFTKGFVGEMKETITKRELELLPLSALILTYECGIRFLADYLNGDTYFKIHREGHNLDRCRTQFKLVADIESKLDELSAIVKKYA